MKGSRNPFEEEDVDPEAYQQDIIKLLRELSKPNQLGQSSHQENSNINNPHSQISQEPILSEESQFPVSKHSPSPKKKHYIHKKHHHLKHQTNQAQSDLQFYKFSNMSQGANDERSIQSLNLRELPKDFRFLQDKKNVSLIRSTSQKVQEREKIVTTLRSQVRHLEQICTNHQEQFQSDKSRQKTILKQVLCESYNKQLQYQHYMQFIGQQNRKILNISLAHRLETQIVYLRTEEPKIKLRKSKKIQTQSDQEQFKQMESVDKERKSYFTTLINKLQKIKQKIIISPFSLCQMNIQELSEQKRIQLQRHQKLKNTVLLCMLKNSCGRITQIMGFDLQKLQEVVICSYRFNPTTARQKRKEIYQLFLEKQQNCKKLLACSAKHIFLSKSLLFIPLSSILYTEQEVLLVNQSIEETITFQSFLYQLDFASGQPNWSIIRFLVKIFLKAGQEVSQQANQGAVILPSNIYLNDKFEPRFRNIVFNMILYKQFRHLLSEDDLHYFPPEQKADPACFALWSIGILTYLLCYGVKPFQKYQPFIWGSRQEFLVMNQLQPPFKTVQHQKCKQFIQICLSHKNSFNFCDFNCQLFSGSK